MSCQNDTPNIILVSFKQKTSVQPKKSPASSVAFPACGKIKLDHLAINMVVLVYEDEI